MTGKPETKSVEVQLPVVKLRVEDLSWLMGMAKETDEVKCHPPSQNMGRLKILGLVEDYELPPCPKNLKEFEDRRKAAEERIRKAVRPKSIDWGMFASQSWHNLQDNYKPGKRIATRITQAGRNLIKDGIAQVQIAKSCR